MLTWATSAITVGRHSGDQVHKVKKNAAPLFSIHGFRYAMPYLMGGEKGMLLVNKLAETTVSSHITNQCDQSTIVPNYRRSPRDKACNTDALVHPGGSILFFDRQTRAGGDAPRRRLGRGHRGRG